MLPDRFTDTLSRSAFSKFLKIIFKCLRSRSNPALHRLEEREWLQAEWKDTSTGREAKFYKLTAKGCKQLEVEMAGWERLADAVSLILRTAYATARGSEFMNKRRLLRLWQKPLAERHLDSELQFHVEQQIAEHIAAGMSPQEASRRARAEFGGVELYKEECRDTRWENQLDIFVCDLRIAVRGLLKDRRFAFVSILVLALAIGASHCGLQRRGERSCRAISVQGSA